MAEEQQQCVFCHIAEGKIPSKKVYEDDKVTAVLDINPATPGHVLLITKEHAAIMPQMSDELVAHIGMVSKQLSHSMLRSLKVEGTSIFVANGVVAGQRAPHFMLHIIPRRPNDNVALQWPPGKLDEKTMQELFEKVAPAVEKQFGKKPPMFSESKEETKEIPKEEPKEEMPPKEEVKEEKKEEPKKEKPSNLNDIADFLTGKK